MLTCAILMTSLHSLGRDHENEIVQPIEVKVNKKSIATFAIFGKKHADLTALITHLHKKPLKGKVMGKSKKQTCK